MRRLSLTFDNGPAPGVTEEVLSALAKRGLRATFFMVGERLRQPRGRETAWRVRNSGHRIGNHTMSHGAPLGEGASRRRVSAEIGGGERALVGLTGAELLFRPNGRGRLGPHLLNREAVEYLLSGRYTVVTWNCVPRDWEQPNDGWVGRAREAIEGLDWTVLVLHDIHAGAVAHLPDFLDWALDAGIEIRPDFPRSCTPILQGRVQWPIEGVVANGCLNLELDAAD